MKRSLYNIVWMGNYERGPQCWWVRVAHQKIQKSFLVKTYGSKAKALAAAIRWRDKMLKQYPNLHNVRGHRLKYKRNKTGVIGVDRGKHVKMLMGGKKRVYWHWSARWSDKYGQQHHRSWSIRKYGEAGARALAVAHRKKMISQRGFR